MRRCWVTSTLSSALVLASLASGPVSLLGPFYGNVFAGRSTARPAAQVGAAGYGSANASAMVVAVSLQLAHERVGLVAGSDAGGLLRDRGRGHAAARGGAAPARGRLRARAGAARGRRRAGGGQGSGRNLRRGLSTPHASSSAATRRRASACRRAAAPGCASPPPRGRASPSCRDRRRSLDATAAGYASR